MKDFEKALHGALHAEAEPTDALNRRVLEKANRKRYSEVYKGLKIAAGCAAAFVIGVTALANSGEAMAQTIQNVPVIGTLAKLVTFRTYTDESGDFLANIEIPELEAFGNAEKQVNADMKAYCDSLIQMYEADKASSGGEGHYDLKNTASVILDNEKYVTVRMDTTLVMAGATQFARYYTVDKQADRVLELSDLFAPAFDYKTYIFEEVVRQMKDRMAKDDSLYYFAPGVEESGLALTELPETMQFYVSGEKTITVSFDEYEVAPGYMGVQTFEVPLP